MKLKYPAGEDALPEDLNKDWEEFFMSEHTRKPGEDFYQEIFDSPLLFPLQRIREMEWMMQQARAYNPKVVYEIGADKGGGLYHWCKCLPTVTHVVACEVRGTPYAQLFEQAFPHLTFLWLPFSSFDPVIVEKVRDWIPNPIDCLFIDGDKSHFDTDFRRYHSMLGSPSVAFMHDIQDEAPGYGYKQTIKRYRLRHLEYINKSESLASVRRQKEGLPASTVHEQWLRYWHGRSCGVGMLRVGELR